MKKIRNFETAALTSYLLSSEVTATNGLIVTFF